RPSRGGPWYPTSLRAILLSEAALGYLMHKGRPVIGKDGNPLRVSEGLWDRATHEALKSALLARKMPTRRTNQPYLLTGVALCGNCHNRLYTQTSVNEPPRYVCTARNKGWPSADNCRPAPLIQARRLDAWVAAWFLEKHGAGEIFETVYDSGNGVAERIAELQANRSRLRTDREAGLYDAEDDARWFRERYADLGRELVALQGQPSRPPGMVQRPTGETVADRWEKALDVQARKEMLLDFNIRVTLFPASGPVRWVPGIVHGPEPDPVGHPYATGSSTAA
uniref:zinc ribbon domain-containing protein n=1 Tax=Streptomyces sp. bgisy031 TaxID=3413772 RepID=UPI003D74A59E